MQRQGSRRVLLIGGGQATKVIDQAVADLGEKVVGRFAHVVMHVPDYVAREATRLAIETRAGLAALGTDGGRGDQGDGGCPSARGCLSG